MRSGARLSSITLTTASGAPYAKASPVPVSPSSVTTRTTICLRVPALHVEGGSMGFMGMASGMAWIAVIFMRLGSVVEGFGGKAPPDPDLLQGFRAHAGEKALPVVDADDPALEPVPVALHGPALLVEAVVEVVVAPVVTLDGRRVGAEGLVDDRGDLDLGREHEPGVAQDALARPDLLG